MAGVNFAPGEREIEQVRLSPSVILFWLRTSLGVSSRRLVWKAPNTLFGLIPLGSNEEATPLSNTASVSVNVRFSVGRAVIGFFWLIISLGLFGSDAAFAGLLFLILAFASFANTLSAALVIRNNGGGIQKVKVSILDKARLESFAEKVKQQLFTDHDQLRHQDSMNIQQAQLNQQTFLNSQIAANAQMQQAPQQANQQQNGSTPPPKPTPA